MNFTSSYFKSSGKLGYEDILYKNSTLKLGQVKEIIYADDERNNSKGKYVEYDVLVYDDKGGKVVQRARQLSLLFNSNDFQEIILEDNKIAFEDGKLDTVTPLSKLNGTLVLLLYLNQKINDPIIIGAIPHPRVHEEASKVSFAPAQKSEGITYKSEFRGLQTKINNDGEFELTYLGNRDLEGNFEREDTHPTSVKINNTGKLSIFDKEKNSIAIDRSNKTITLKQTAGTISNNNGEFESPDLGDIVNKVEMDKTAKKITTIVGTDAITEVKDGNSEKVTLNFKSGLQVSIDGAGDNVTITTAGGAELLVDGSTGSIEAKDNGLGRLKISNGQVGLGTPTAELVTEFGKLLDALLGLTLDLQIETHIGNLGYPSSPPLNSTNYSNINTTITAIRALITTINGGV